MTFGNGDFEKWWLTYRSGDLGKWWLREVVLPCTCGLPPDTAKRTVMAAWLLHGVCCGRKPERETLFFQVKWLQLAMKGSSCKALLQKTNVDFQRPQAHRTTHTHEEPRIAKHHGGTNHAPKRTALNRLAHDLPFISDCNPLYLKKHNVSRSGFLPRTRPMQHSCSHSNAFGNAAKPAWIYAHGNTTWQHSCSHTNAICNQRFHKLIELRTHEEPRIAKHYMEEPITHQNERPATTSRTSCLCHFPWKNTMFRPPASSPKQAPCNSHAATTMRFAVSGGSNKT